MDKALDRPGDEDQRYQPSITASRLLFEDSVLRSLPRRSLSQEHTSLGDLVLGRLRPYETWSSKAQYEYNCRKHAYGYSVARRCAMLSNLIIYGRRELRVPILSLIGKVLHNLREISITILRNAKQAISYSSPSGQRESDPIVPVA